MANKIGSIKVYRDGAAHEVASIYDGATAAQNLVIRHDGANCYVPLSAGNASGRLALIHNGVRFIAASPIKGRHWYARATDANIWGWLASDSTAAIADSLDADDANVSVWVTNVNAVAGDAENVFLTLAAGKTVDDVSVSGASSLAIFVVSGKDYKVVSGKLVRAVPLSTAVVNKMRRPDNKAVARTIDYVNPDASDDDIAAAVNALNALSANSSAGILRLNRQRR